MKPHRFFQAALALLFLFFPAMALAQGLERVAEGARKEGKVKVGITVRWQEGGKPAAKRMVEVFQTRYPFVKV
ncbi:MAG: hypothetical protein ACREQP_23595, partial [Candidatus Binatia bacterium]